MKTKSEIEDKIRRINTLLTSEKEDINISSRIKCKLNHQREILEWVLQ